MRQPVQPQAALAVAEPLPGAAVTEVLLRVWGEAEQTLAPRRAPRTQRPLGPRNEDETHPRFTFD